MRASQRKHGAGSEPPDRSREVAGSKRVSERRLALSVVFTPPRRRKKERGMRRWD